MPGRCGTVGRCQPNFHHPSLPLGFPPRSVLLPFSLPLSRLHRRLKYGHKWTCKATQRTRTARAANMRCVCRPIRKHPHAVPCQINRCRNTDPIFLLPCPATSQAKPGMTACCFVPCTGGWSRTSWQAYRPTALLFGTLSLYKNPLCTESP